MTIQLLQGDACEMLRTLPDQSVQCIVTSPPYFGLRKYTDDPREIGHEPTPAAFVAALVAVFYEARRVLRDDGTLWVVIGDSYSQSSTYQAPRMMHTEAGWKQPEANHDFRLNAKSTGIPAKNLLGIPWRLAFALQDDGWILRQEIIWSKPNGMPESVKDRPTRSHETVFLFSKCPHYFYDAAAIAVAAKRPGDIQTFGSRKGTAYNPEPGDPNYRNGSEQWGRTITVGETRNARSVWGIATTALSEDHYAPMPEDLARRCILAGSAAGDTVLDPFMGSGTVGRVAEKLQRHAIGIDLGYQELQLKRTDGVQVELFV